MMATTQFYQNLKYRLYPTVPAVMIGLKVKVFYLNKSKSLTVVILSLWCYHIIRLYPPPHPRPGMNHTGHQCTTETSQEQTE